MTFLITAFMLLQVGASGNSAFLAEMDKISKAFTPQGIISTNVVMEYEPNIHDNTSPVEQVSMDIILNKDFQYLHTLGTVIIVENDLRLEVNAEAQLMFLTVAASSGNMVGRPLEKIREIVGTDGIVGTVGKYSDSENILEVKDESGEYLMMKIIYDSDTYLISYYEEVFPDFDETTFQVVLSKVKLTYSNHEKIAKERIPKGVRIADYVTKTGDKYVPLRKYENFEFYIDQ